MDLLYFERPPYYETAPGGQATGLVAGVADQAFVTAGICRHWLKLPAARHLPWIRGRHQRPACAVGWFKNAQRQQYARFSRPLYQDQPLVAVTRRDSGLKNFYPSAADLLKQENLVLGVRSGFSYGGYLDREIARWRPPVYATSRAVSGLLHMLEHQRIDYLFMAREEADHLLRNGAAERIMTIVLGDMPKGNKRYLLCSKSLPGALMQRLNAAIGPG